MRSSVGAAVPESLSGSIEVSAASTAPVVVSVVAGAASACDVLEVQSHIGDLGNKSMDVHYVLTCGEQVVAKAKTVLVCFDHKTQATIPVPEAWRTALEALKAHSPFIES